MSNYKYKFSIVTAVYNVEPFIREAIESIVDQDIGFSEIQFILVDDGSTDKSGEICDEYALKYPENITVLHKQNGGVSSARNAGIDVAEGEYINFFDSDDKLSLNTLSKVWEFIEQNRDEADIFAIPLKFFDGERGAHPLNNKFEKGSRIIDLNEEWKATQIHTNSSFIKRDIIEDLRFDTSLCFSEDAKFMQQLLLKSSKLGVVSDALYYFRKRTKGEALALLNSTDRSQWYLPVMKGYFKSIINYSIEKEASVPKFLQMALMYDMQWRIKQETIATEAASLSEEGKKEYCDIIKECLSYIENEVILCQRNIFDEHKVFTLSLKYGIKPQFEFSDNDIYACFPDDTKVAMSNCRLAINDITFANGKFFMNGYTVLFKHPFSEVQTYLKIGEQRIPCTLKSRSSVSKCFGESTGTIYRFSASIPVDNSAQTLSVKFETELDGHNIVCKKLIFKFIPSGAEDSRIFSIDSYRHIKEDKKNLSMNIICDEAPNVESAISVRDVQIKYRCLNKISLLKAIMNPKNFSKTEYFEAVKGVSFEVEKGKILGIVGKNGSGKSTLLRAIAGIFSPDEGSIDLHGHTISLLSIGVGFQNALTGRENIYLSGMLLGFEREQIEAKIEEIIEFSELGDFIDRPVKTYSSGMYSKLAFSITAILETEIMLIDEVLSVGDARFKKKSYAKMKELIGNKERTVIIVSHSSETLSKLCDNILWLHDGEIKMFGTTGEVLPAYNKFMS